MVGNDPHETQKSLNSIQRALFAFTTMVTVAHLLNLFLGIQSMVSTVIIAVLVWILFYARARQRGGAPTPQDSADSD